MTDWTPEELYELICQAPWCTLLITLDNHLCAHHAEKRRQLRARTRTRRRAGTVPANPKPC